MLKKWLFGVLALFAFSALLRTLRHSAFAQKISSSSTDPRTPPTSSQIAMEDDREQINEYIRDVFNRAVTYYTFHIGLNYIAVGWLVTTKAPTSRLIWFLALIFIFHNLCACVSYGAGFLYLRRVRSQAGVDAPPYTVFVGVMILTLVALVLIWLLVPVFIK